MRVLFCKPAPFFFFLLYTNFSIAQAWREINPPSNLFNDGIYSITADNTGNLYAAGKFRNTKNEFVVAKWDGSNWNELGSETNSLKANNVITCVATDNEGYIYAAGRFTNTTGNISIAQWSGTGWSELGGMAQALKPNGTIYAMTLDPSGNLYVAGGFTDSADKNYVAKWNGTTWSELGSGAASLNAEGLIYSLAADASGTIYAAGHFTSGNGKYNVAKWNGANWSEVGGAASLNATDYINCIKVDSVGNLYAGGAFKNNVGDYYIAKWNGSNWSELGTGGAALKANGPINAIAIDKAGNVYTGGFGTNEVGNTNLVEWDGATWKQVFDVGYSTDDAIRTIYLDKKGNVYAAGDFKNNSGYNYVAKWDGTKLSEPGRFGDNLKANNGIKVIAVDTKGQVYAAGGFINRSGSNYIARWDGITWSELGGDTASLNIRSYNLAMTTDLSDNLYVSGDFKDENGQYYIARWNGHTWHKVENPAHPITIWEPVTLLTTDKAGNIYAGGAVGDSTSFLHCIMKWNGTDWFLYPYGLGSPSSLCVDTAGNIYAGNALRDENGKYYVEKITKTGVTKLGSGATALNSGSLIRELAIDGKGNLLAGGLNNEGFSAYNNFVAKWDGKSWSTAGTNSAGPYAEGYVEDLVTGTDGTVYAASATNSNSKFTVAKWDGASWSELGSGENSLNANSLIGDLAVDIKGNIYAAGLFGNAQAMEYVAVWGKSALFLQQPVLSPVLSQYCKANSLQKIKISNLPDTTWITTHVTVDNISLPITADSSFILTPAALTTGNHHLNVSFGTRTDSLFAIKDFTITAAVTPDVNITTSTTTIVNADPVAIMAMNIAGGGNAPKFTFAKDRAMHSVLQAESLNSICNLNPSVLSAGANWIYVQMRTSENCYTSQLSIDSIKMTVATTTAVRDVDDPRQEIRAYPMPAKGRFTINGLQVSKSYQIFIVNAMGQTVCERKIFNSSHPTITLPNLIKGNFWLTIYDLTKKRMLGTIPLLIE